MPNTIAWTNTAPNRYSLTLSVQFTLELYYGTPNDENCFATMYLNHTQVMQEIFPADTLETACRTAVTLAAQKQNEMLRTWQNAMSYLYQYNYEMA